MLLLPYLLIAAGLLATLALFMALKREMRRQAERQKARLEEIAARVEESKLNRQSEQQSEQPEPAETFVPAPLRAGLNLNKRVHAMRMLRRGEDISYISAALGVPRREVELLIRVQSIGRARVANAGSD